MRATWQSEDGRVQLYRGDARRVLAQLPDASVDLVWMDPPYGHDNNNGDLIHRREAALGRPAKRGGGAYARPIRNDGPEANGLFRGLLADVARMLRADCCCCCCCGGGGPDPQFARWSLWLDEAMTFQQMIVWDKGPMGMGWKYRRSYETVLVASKGKSMAWHDRTKRIENVIRPGDGIKKIIPRAADHPTPKPVALAKHFLALHTKRNQIVLDPFAGHGPAAIAAIEMGRRYIGVEIDAGHFATMKRRVQNSLRATDKTRAAA